MSTPEILSKLTAKTANYSGVGHSRGVDDLGWQDILQAMQGIDHWKISFMLYVYGDNPRGRHEFFAGLFLEVMQHPEVQAWIRHRKEQAGYHRAVETMCLLAMVEWKHWNVRIIEVDRATHMGVSLSTWKRKYKLIYQTIAAIPAEWESEVMKIVTQRLR